MQGWGTSLAPSMCLSTSQGWAMLSYGLYSQGLHSYGAADDVRDQVGGLYSYGLCVMVVMGDIAMGDIAMAYIVICADMRIDMPIDMPIRLPAYVMRL